VDLQTGQLLPHSPFDYCTKITAESPTDEGAKIFTDFLSVITCGDKDLETYLQLIAGMFAIGTVYCEVLVIAYGGGRNGKSTFFNLLARVMGDYSGNISAETLTVNCRKNKSPEYAELRGKRLVIAAELEEGMRLDTAIVKKLCSTDTIYAEKKYKDPFSFTPSHTVVLYTNHLPRVGTTDAGTWRRLIAIPFNAVIDGESDIKNYADYLFREEGGAVLSWIIEGARKFIASKYKIEPPEIVKKAIDNYRGDNDWVNNYIYERCEINETYTQKSGELYDNYREYCKRTGNYIRSCADFKAALEETGYKWQRTNKGGMFNGLRLLQDVLSFEPPTYDSGFAYVQPANIGVQVPILPRVTEDYGDNQNFSEDETDF
jgi:P4 family phage/plasmid primase-like protien